MTFEATAYTAGDAEAWNAFVRQSKNGTFLFDRAYMDYHRDRFADASLLLRDGNSIVALIPANRDGVRVVSHGGLTYGGLILSRDMTIGEAMEALDCVLRHYAAAGAQELVYKTIPSIYHRVPASEDCYALFRHGAALVRRDVLSVIDYREEIRPQERRMRSIKRAKKSGVVVEETRDYSAFWEVLARNLQERFGLAPVHSLDEIELLAARFPENIRLFGAWYKGCVVAGAVVYVTPSVCHVQYNAASAQGKNVGGLDAVLAELVQHFRDHVRYFDFGISTEKNGTYLNAGLVEYKEGFGSRTVVHDFYRVDLRSLA